MKFFRCDDPTLPTHTQRSEARADESSAVRSGMARWRSDLEAQRKLDYARERGRLDALEEIAEAARAKRDEARRDAERDYAVLIDQRCELAGRTTAELVERMKKRSADAYKTRATE